MYTLLCSIFRVGAVILTVAFVLSALHRENYVEAAIWSILTLFLFRRAKKYQYIN